CNPTAARSELRCERPKLPSRSTRRFLRRSSAQAFPAHSTDAAVLPQPPTHRRVVGAGPLLADAHLLGARNVLLRDSAADQEAPVDVEPAKAPLLLRRHERRGQLPGTGLTRVQ